jgi:hypothetical protein
MNMEVRLNFVQLQSQFEETKRKLKKRHPSFFDEYKYYQKEMYPNQEKSEEEYWDDFAFMAFKIELVKTPKNNIDYDIIDQIMGVFALHKP